MRIEEQIEQHMIAIRFYQEYIDTYPFAKIGIQQAYDKIKLLTRLKQWTK